MYVCMYVCMNWNTMKLNTLCNIRLYEYTNMNLYELDHYENEIIFMNMKLHNLKINYTNIVRNDI